MTDDRIEKLREHLERHKNRQQAFFSIDGPRALFEKLGEVTLLEEKLKSAEMRAYQLEGQVKRLLSEKAKDIGKALRK
jgi:hypothetical protein